MGDRFARRKLGRESAAEANVPLTAGKAPSIGSDTLAVSVEGFGGNHVLLAPAHNGYPDGHLSFRGGDGFFHYHPGCFAFHASTARGEPQHPKRNHVLSLNPHLKGS